VAIAAIARFTHLAAGGVFTTAELHPHVAEVLGRSEREYKLGSLRYDLSKLRAKNLVEKIPHSRRYQLTNNGYRICVAYVKLFDRSYAPVVGGILQPFPADARVPADRVARLGDGRSFGHSRKHQRDRRYPPTEDHEDSIVRSRSTVHSDWYVNGEMELCR
jgi:hypothetical protein